MRKGAQVQLAVCRSALLHYLAGMEDAFLSVLLHAPLPPEGLSLMGVLRALEPRFIDISTALLTDVFCLHPVSDALRCVNYLEKQSNLQYLLFLHLKIEKHFEALLGKHICIIWKISL